MINYKENTVSRGQKYHPIEKSVGSKVKHRFVSFFSAIGNFFARIFKVFAQKLTVMIVPHSNGKVLNIQTNVFALVLGFVVIGGIVSSFVYINKKNAGSSMEIARLREENRETLASLDELRDENNNLLQTARRFQSSLSKTLSMLGIEQTSSVTKSTDSNSDLSSLFSTQDFTSGTLREASDIRQLTAYLESAIEPVEETGRMIENQGALFQDIPSIWPIKNGIGHISMAFGQNIHPKTGQWYIHKGMDFSTWRSGDPIVATANGQIVTVGYDASFGNYIIIKHKHGYYTRYAHMSTTRVNKGDMVTQGQVIGTIGDTGIVTGPHLHYEVHIGSDVVDPAKYINAK